MYVWDGFGVAFDGDETGRLVGRGVGDEAFLLCMFKSQDGVGLGPLGDRRTGEAGILVLVSSPLQNGWSFILILIRFVALQLRPITDC